MISRVRIILAVMVCLAVLGLVELGRWRPDPDAGSSHPALAHQDCRQCHARVWRQWQRSFHSRSYSDPNVRAALEHFGWDPKCRTCHAPLPVLVTGIGREVRSRPDDTQSGVNCLSCHGLPGGRSVAARRTIADAPCRPVQRSELVDGRMCGACHHAIFRDWQASRYSKEGRTCGDCHMPPSDDQPGGRPGGRSHACLGGHDAATVRSGVQMDCRREGDELAVSVTNHATGHNFPGERHNRVLLLRVIERDVRGRIVLYRQETIKQVTPFRGESSAEKIRAGDTFWARFPLVETAAAADVRLLYKAFPWQSADEDILVVHQTTIELTEQ